MKFIIAIIGLVVAFGGLILGVWGSHAPRWSQVGDVAEISGMAIGVLGFCVFIGFMIEGFEQ